MKGCLSSRFRTIWRRWSGRWCSEGCARVLKPNLCDAYTQGLS
jgi:hypothetical protein